MKHLCYVGIWVAAMYGQVGSLFAATVIRVSDFGDGTCSLPNVQAAYNTASAGDTIVLPAGASAWSSGLVVSKPVTIKGAGSGIGGTKLTAAPSLGVPFIKITTITSANLVRVSGICFDLVNNAPAEKIGISVEGVSLDKLRIDHNEFHFGYEQIHVEGSKGVIDHNRFYNPLKGISFSAGTAEQASASWAAMTPGTGDALFIEDNDFIDDANYVASFTQERIGTFNGGKLVIRYNRWDCSAYPNASTIDPILTHGSAAAGAPGGYWQIGNGARRAQSIVEIYGNVMTGKRIDFLAILRGGSNLIFSNRLSNTAGAAPKARIYMREEEYTEPQWSPLRTAWPAEDQVHNTFIWSNVIQASAQTSANIAIGDLAGVLQEGRDYFLHEPQATGGKATFTGLNGASGSFPTDGVTFPTRGTMVFTAGGPNAYFPYTPYVYPHPLLRASSPIGLDLLK